MGCSIGNNCIIGANSVVACDIPDNCVAAGVPARVICSVEDYYKKSRKKWFYPTATMTPKEYLLKNVPLLNNK